MSRRPARQRRVEARRYRELARHASDVVLIVDADGRVQYLSPSAERLMGYREDEWLGQDGLQVFHPDDMELAAGAFGRALATPGVNDPLEVRVRRVGDGWRWFELVATSLLDDPDIRGVVICARDITDLKTAHDEISRNARRSEALLANLSDMVSVIDAHGQMTYVSPASERLLGRRAEDRLGASIFDYVHPDDAGHALELLDRGLRSPEPVEPFDVRMRHEDGTYRVFEVRANNLLGDPAVEGIIVNSRDVTDRVIAEAALFESERLYRTIVETAEEGVWLIDANAITTFVNVRMASLLGISTDDMIGRSLFDFADDEGRHVVKRNLEDRRGGIGGRYEFRFVRIDGTAFWATVSATPFLDDDGTYQGSIALVADITDRRRAEVVLREAELEQHRYVAEIERHRLQAELAQARRLESLGRLAAGVAHDFNNLLGVILNYSSVAAKQLGPTDPVADDLAQIRQAAEQAADLTRKLLVFGRSDSLRLETLDLNSVVESVSRLVERSFGDKITILTHLTTDDCSIYADRGQIEQVLMNLLVNARDALTSGGVVTVTTHREADNAQSATSSTCSDVALTVADNGAGMSSDVLERALEPFFTTKTAEHGSGLGLATVHAIAERAGGRVTIESEVGVGTTVTVYFPT